MINRLIALIGSSAALVATAAVAQEYPTVSPIFAETNLYCYMHTDSSLSLDLTSLCGRSPLSDSDDDSDDFSGSSAASGSSSRSASSSSGPSQFPDDRDSAGRRCGNRAASVKPGGN